MLFIIVLIFVGTSILTYATDPGHYASSISAGTFESGNYTFPDSTFITNKIGIAVTTPTHTLNVKGDVNITKGIFTNLTSCTIGTSSTGMLICTTSAISLTNVAFVNESNTFTLNNTFEGINITRQLQVHDNLLYVDPINNKVGIGTTSPLYKLDVNGTSIFRDDLYISNQEPISFVNNQYIKDNSNGGLVINSGLYKLQLQGGTNETNGIVELSTNGAVRMVVKNSGNVGINTTSPSHTLSVLGTINATASTTILQLDSNGNVRIGI